MPLQSNGVQTKKMGPVARGTHVRGHILGHSRRSPDDGITTHSNKLVNGHQSSNDGEIFHFDMPGEGSGIGQNDLVSHPAIMGDMGIRHDEIALAQNGLTPSFHGPPIDGYEFSNYIFIADNEPGWLPPVAQVLRRGADGSKRKYMAAFTDFARPFDDYVGFDDRPASDAHIFTDQAVRAYFYSGSDIRLRVDNGRRVNVQSSLL
jgi:hypothetical protein